MNLGRMLIVLGVILVVAGVLVTVGRLPGDITIRGKNSVFYFPLTTCILLSVLFSLLMWFFNRR